MQRSIGIGIAGIGRIGRLHAEVLTRRVPGATVRAVCDPFAVDAPWLDELGIAVRYASHHELLADPAVDAVYVCSSTDTHAQIVIDAARAGKHLLCEKPIDLDPLRIREALDAVRAAGVLLQVGFNRRFDHNHAKAAEAVREGRIGKVELIKITSRDPAPPPTEYLAASGGLFLDMMIHDFDMVRFLAADEVTAVHAAGAALVDPAIAASGDIDTAVVTLWLESGAIAVIDNSRRAVYGYDQRSEVFGSGGMIRVENDLPNGVQIFDRSGSHGQNPLHFFLERYGEAFVAESRAFVAAVAAGGPVPVTGQDGLAPVYIALAASRSLAQGRRVAVSEVTP